MPFSLQRNVLLVDDESSFVELMGELFEQWGKGGWKVHCATNTAKALKILDDRQIDLIVLDWHMPVVDGAQFLRLIDKKCPGTPKAVLTGHSSDDLRATSTELGADLFLEKPRQAEAWEIVFAALNELAKCHTQEGFRGLLRQVGLSDVLQMECLGRNSCVLELTASENSGLIFIKTGQIVHAESGEFQGEEAFQKLFALRGGNFSLRPFIEPTSRTIDVNWEMLLMEAARRQDECEDPAISSATTSTPSSVPSLNEWLAATGQASVPQSDGPERKPDSASGSRVIDEVIIRSDHGEVIYAWDSDDMDGRLKLMALIGQKAGQLAQEWSFGSMDRLEVEGAAGRAVIHSHADRQIWVRTHLGSPQDLKNVAPMKLPSLEINRPLAHE